MAGRFEMLVFGVCLAVEAKVRGIEIGLEELSDKHVDNPTEQMLQRRGVGHALAVTVP